MKKIIIVIFGAPGAGKGYLCDCLVRELKKLTLLQDKDFTYISTGDLLRQEIKAESDLGQRVKAILDSGRFVDDSTITELFGKALGAELKAVTLIDGYPRTQGQFFSLCKILEGLPVCVINRDTPVQVIFERVSQRRICTVCGRTQSVQEKFCISCGNDKLTQRIDDLAIEERLKNFTDFTEHLYDLFQEKYPDNCYKVNGQEDAAKTAPRLAKIIKCQYL